VTQLVVIKKEIYNGFTAVLFKIVTLLRLLEPKDEGSTMLRNVRNYYATTQRQSLDTTVLYSIVQYQ
jgi:hypothetical protein